MSDIRTTLETGGSHPHPDEHDPRVNAEAAIGPKTEWSRYMLSIYQGRKPPSIGSYDVAKLEEKAREVTKEYHGASMGLPLDNTMHADGIYLMTISAAYMYTFGSAGTSSTNKANIKALQQWRIIPRMLRDASSRNLDVGLLFSFTSTFTVSYMIYCSVPSSANRTNPPS